MSERFKRKDGYNWLWNLQITEKDGGQVHIELYLDNLDVPDQTWVMGGTYDGKEIKWGRSGTIWIH